MPAVQINLMKAGALVVIDNHQVVLALDHLEKRAEAEHCSRQTADLRIVFGIGLATVAGHGLRGG